MKARLFFSTPEIPRRCGVAALRKACRLSRWMLCAFFLSSPTAVPWQAPCTPAQGRAAEMFLGQDKLIEADSVYSALELECSLSPSDLLKWMRVKAVLFQFSEAGRIACLAVLKQADVAFLVQEQLVDLIKETGIDTIRSVMRSYLACILSSRKQDTATVRKWISGVYHQFKLYDEEADVLLKLDSKNYPSANDLFASAQRRFSQRFFSGAIQLALPAYQRLPDETQKSFCALMLYQSYAQTGKNDSAGLWLGRAPLTRPDSKAQAIVFLERAGLASKADSIITTLPRSLMRDTFSLRQKIFSAAFENAADQAGRLAATSPSGRVKNAFLLWRIRALLFGGKGAAAEELMDSVEFSPAMDGAEEFLSYKYRCAVIGKSSGAWGIFGSVAYASWLMNPDKAFDALRRPELDACAPEARQTIVLDGVRTLMGGKRFREARAIMERAGFSPAGNEFRYYYGEVLYNGGAVDSGRKVLQDLLLMHPGDVFAEKARIFLLRTNDDREGGRHGNTMDEKRDH